MCLYVLGDFVGWPLVAVSRISAAPTLEHLLCDGDVDGRYSQGAGTTQGGDGGHG